jgi:hypothetical protein
VRSDFLGGVNRTPNQRSLSFASTQENLVSIVNRVLSSKAVKQQKDWSRDYDTINLLARVNMTCLRQISWQPDKNNSINIP